MGSKCKKNYVIHVINASASERDWQWRLVSILNSTVLWFIGNSSSHSFFESGCSVIVGVSSVTTQRKKHIYICCTTGCYSHFFRCSKCHFLHLLFVAELFFHDFYCSGNRQQYVWLIVSLFTPPLTVTVRLFSLKLPPPLIHNVYCVRTQTHVLLPDLPTLACITYCLIPQ